MNSQKEIPHKIQLSLPILLTAALINVFLVSCAKQSPYKINLMPSPEIYAENGINPFYDLDENIEPPYDGILYATDRQPSGSEKPFYLNKRDWVLRLGIGQIDMGEGDITWEEARKISLLKNRAANYPLWVSGVEELGILDLSMTRLVNLGYDPKTLEEPGKRFAEAIDKKLALSSNRDVYIYVHGYKVVFDNPLLVATELWHFLGYDGVFIAYAWPSTPERLAYTSDLETAAFSSYYLRLLLEFVAEKTQAEQVHIVGYSAGTRVVIKALEQLSLMQQDETKAEIQERYRIGNVILVGSDYDRQLFGAHLMDGILRVPKKMSIYLSDRDKALGISRWVFRRPRLGQMWKEDGMTKEVKAYLNEMSDLAFIDVTNAEGATTGNGHAYFRDSPWISSDILVTLMYQKDPAQRGLIRSPDSPIWKFPETYIDNLKTVLLEANPDLYRQSGGGSHQD